jgi:hypothetical protein
MQHGLDICFDNTTPFYSTTFLETFPTWPKLDNVWGTKSWFKYFRYLESLGVQFGLMGMFPFDSHTLALYVEMCLVYTLAHSKFWSLVHFQAFGKHSISFHFEKYTLLSISSINHAPKLKSWLNISWEKEEQEHKVHQLIIININIFIFFIFLEQFCLIDFVI